MSFNTFVQIPVYNLEISKFNKNNTVQCGRKSTHQKMDPMIKFSETNFSVTIFRDLIFSTSRRN